jgi:SAM-dependent methyltransferase
MSTLDDIETAGPHLLRKPLGSGMGRPHNKGETVPQVLSNGAMGRYVLATGEAADYRLRLLHDLYGPGTRRLLADAGLRPGMRVADLGCGVGMVTALLAELVDPRGHVVGIDASAAQLARARERLNAGGSITSFVEASATDTGLPPGSFDLVYCERRSENGAPRCP